MERYNLKKEKCRKTKIKNVHAITLANHKAREKVCGRITIGFYLFSDWMKKRCEF